MASHMQQRGMIKEGRGTSQRQAAAQPLPVCVSPSPKAIQRGSMTKQMKAAMAAMLMVGTLPMMASEPLSITAATVTRSAEGTAPAQHKAKGKRKVIKAKVESETARMIRELTEKQAAQQAQIDELKQENATAKAQLAAAQTAASGAEAQAQTATQQAASVTANVQANTDAVQSLKSNVSDLQTINGGLAATISTNKVELADKIDSPSVIHYKGVKITPVAFFAAEGVYRQKSLNSDVNTPFNAIPYSGANEAHVSEFNFTGRQSRLGGLFEGDAGKFKLSGYFESDFLSAGVTSNNNQSNSYTLRVRQIWGKAETKTGFAVTGGQTWSLVTEDGKSTNARTEKLPATVDAQYVVGFSWARQPGVRLQQTFGKPLFGSAVTLALAAENGQIQNYNATNAPTNFFFAGPGQTGGLYNNGGFSGAQNYTNNVAPDVITKVAFDFPHAHVEVGGLARFFRDRIYPATGSATNGIPSAPGAAPYNNTVIGGGGFASARYNSKYVDSAAAAMVGDGTGRYGSAQLADVTVHPNGTLEPIRNAHGLFSLETHPAPKLDIFGYYGAEYAQRTVYATGVTATPFTGYAPITVNDTGCNTESAVATAATGGSIAPANCAANTRYIQEGVVGFTYRALVSPKYGRLQYQATYSYLTRSAWTGTTRNAAAATVTTPAVTATFGSPYAVEPMVHISMRYYIP